MKFNEKKCYVMRIHQARSPQIHCYTLNKCVLQETTCYGYLGVDISNNLKWNNHIQRITAKASRILGFVRRNLKPCSQSIKLIAYNTLVRPILEYSAAIWDPHAQVLIDKLESIQRRAIRFIKNDYSTYHSVSVMMSELGIKPLSIRRKIARLTNFHKARVGHLAIPIHDILRPVMRFSRHSNINSYIQISAKKNSYLNSFLPNTTRDWNQLPVNITSIQKPKLFQQAIIKHYLNN